MDTIKDKQRLEALARGRQRALARVGPASARRERRPDARAARCSAAATPLRRVLAIGAHADDIEIGCGGTLLALTREQSRPRGRPGSCSAADGRARRRGASERRGVPRRRRATPRSSSTTSATASSRTTASAVKDVFEELKARRARPRPHAHAARPPPGPPARLRADLEHVPRPPDPRVRDPEVRRRPRARRTSSSRSPRSWSQREGRLCSSALRRASATSTGSTTRSSCGLMRLRGMECALAERLRRGVLRAGRFRVTTLT